MRKMLSLPSRRRRVFAAVLATPFLSTAMSVAAADPVPVTTLAHGCMGCHAAPAVEGSGIRTLAGRDADDLLAAMQEYRAPGGTASTSMHRVIGGYSDAELQALADHFAGQEP